jgi:hypothetical protein
MCLKPHEVSVILGRAAVEAYQEGEASLLVLSHLGAVETVRFRTIQEVNAFCSGVELAAGYEDALPVEDLRP